MRTMSNALAIHAVTLALRQRLDRELNAEVPGTRVTTCPPDRARDVTGNQVNLFLYHTVPSRHGAMPRPVACRDLERVSHPWG